MNYWFILKTSQIALTLGRSITSEGFNEKKPMSGIQYSGFYLQLVLKWAHYVKGMKIMLTQTVWIQTNRRVTQWLAWDPTCLPLSLSFPIKNKQIFKVLNYRQHWHIYLNKWKQGPITKGD